MANPCPCQGVAGCCEQILGDVSMKFGTCGLVATASKILPVLCVVDDSETIERAAGSRMNAKDQRSPLMLNQDGNITSLHFTANCDKTILS